MTPRARRLEIAPGFYLPLDAVTETFAYLATRNGGKTYSAGVFVEELLKTDQQVVVIDPMPAWWGLRSSADGKSEGFPIAILGGDHGDVPLEETAGEVVADLIVNERLSAILDVSDFSKSARRRFVTDFAERLYARNRDAMHVVLEEADMFAPQNAKGDERMLGAIEDLVRRGRGRGIGTTLITQRSAVISKNVLDLTENLVVLRTLGSRSRKPIKEWIEDHGTAEERDAVMSSLQKLNAGEAWFYSPHFLGKLERIQYRRKETFDSSATPKPGERRRKPKTVADVDLGALSEAMAETIEKAKADDPELLRQRIRILEQEHDELARRLREQPTETLLELPVIPRDLIEAIDRARVSIEVAVGDLESDVARIDAQTRQERKRRIDRAIEDAPELVNPRDRAATEGAVPRTPEPVKQHDRAATNGELSETEGKILAAIVQNPALTTKRLTTVTGARGGTLYGALASLRKKGYLTERGLALTDEGRAAAPRVELPRGPDLLVYWLERLPAGERKVLEYVYRNGGSLTTQQIGDALEMRGGTLFGALSKLRAKALLVGSSGEIDVAETFR